MPALDRWPETSISLGLVYRPSLPGWGGIIVRVYDESRWRPGHTVVHASAAIWLVILLVAPGHHGDNNCGSLLAQTSNPVCGRPGHTTYVIAAALVLFMLVVSARCSPYTGRRRVASIALDGIVIATGWWSFDLVAFSDQSRLAILPATLAAAAGIARIGVGIERLRNEG